jgi:hypothetical protein
MPLFLRGAAIGASNLGHRRMIEAHGRRLADMGIDPFDLPGKKQDSWIDPTMVYGMGLGLAAHAAGRSGLFGNEYVSEENNIPLYMGTALGGALGAYKTYKAQSELAKDFLEGKETPDTQYVKTRDYIQDTLNSQKSKS